MLKQNQVLYSYVITRDYGFAPNPFGSYCTLATCKPDIRKTAVKGDWVIATGSNSKKISMGNHLIYAMLVEEVLTFESYWNDPRFQYKKPIMNGSKKQKYGDNIYRYNPEERKYYQINSHHSLADGATNIKNLEKDTSGKNVLVSTCFWYFGRTAPLLPESLFSAFTKKGIGYKKVNDETKINNLIEWLSQNYEKGYNGKPYLFEKDFERYNGN
jgi:hypothetical protein